MGKLIINNMSRHTDLQALQACSEVVKNGRISNAGKQYCYATIVEMSGGPDLSIYTDLNKKSDRFTVLDSNERNQKG